MPEITIKQLLEAGVHFGHQTSRWNPRMRPFIFGARNGIHIIDLEQTAVLLRRALDFVRDVAAQGGTLLFVGTKKQAQAVVEAEAERCGMFYVNNRWLGGTLTNFQTIKQRIELLRKLEESIEGEEMARELTKREMLQKRRERDRLLKALRGIRNMRKLPDALFVIDTVKEEIAVREANKLGIPVVAVVDTNSAPELVDYPIPGNDDAVRAIKLFCQAVADAVLEGRAAYEAKLQADETQTGDMGQMTTPTELPTPGGEL